jgi:uroporphyrinogen-III synthase
MLLTGKRVVVTRTRAQASELARRLEERGAEVMLIPTIEIAPPRSFAGLDAALAAIDTFDWLLFTSANAVEVFAQRRGQRALPEKLRLAAVGPATARALQAAGLQAALVPARAVAESFAEALLPHAAGSRMLLVRAEVARDHLPETLRAAGADVTIAEAYRTVIPEGSVVELRRLFRERPPDGITFTSSSTAVNFFALMEAAGVALPADVVLASIGPVTSETLRGLGYPPTVEAEEASAAGLVRALGGIPPPPQSI